MKTMTIIAIESHKMVDQEKYTRKIHYDGAEQHESFPYCLKDETHAN